MKSMFEINKGKMTKLTGKEAYEFLLSIKDLLGKYLFKEYDGGLDLNYGQVAFLIEREFGKEISQSTIRYNAPKILDNDNVFGKMANQNSAAFYKEIARINRENDIPLCSDEDSLQIDIFFMGEKSYTVTPFTHIQKRFLELFKHFLRYGEYSEDVFKNGNVIKCTVKEFKRYFYNFSRFKSICKTIYLSDMSEILSDNNKDIYIFIVEDNKIALFGEELCDINKGK